MSLNQSGRCSVGSRHDVACDKSLMLTSAAAIDSEEEESREDESSP